MTGNTVIDALLQVAEEAKDADIGVEIEPGTRLILVTAHRRENFGDPFEQVCRAIRRIADENADVRILYPVHPNPNVYGPAHVLLANHPRIRLCAPLDYKPFVAAMKRAYFILTVSGGPGGGAGTGQTGAGPPERDRAPGGGRDGGGQTGRRRHGPHRRLSAGAAELGEAYRRMAKGVSPYGDGRAAERIAETLTLNVSVSAVDISAEPTTYSWSENNGSQTNP